MSCRFYAANGQHGKLIPKPGTDFCALIVSSNTPCFREVEGLSVDEDACNTVSFRADQWDNCGYLRNPLTRRLEECSGLSDADKAQRWVEEREHAPEGK